MTTSISQSQRASRTAMWSACGRGAHVMTRGPAAALNDWLAWPLLGANAGGETLLSAFTPPEFADLVTECGFQVTDDVGPEVAPDRFGYEVLALGFERLALASKGDRL